MMRSKLIVTFVAASLAGVVFAAGGCSGGKAAGTEGGPCKPMNLCDMGLSCISSVCVNTNSEGGTTDAKAPDAKMDAPKETTPPGPMCPTPDNMAAMGYMPTYIPPNAVSSDCNSTQIQGYYDNCQDDTTATTMKCQAWGMANMACATCLESSITDAKWGPLVIGNGIISLNISGCVDIRGDKTCAQNYQALDGCTRVACDMICPVMDNQSFADWQKCVNTAETGVCKSYNDKVTMTCLNDASSAYSYCSNFGGTFKDGIFFYAALFCGGSSDGGGGGG